MEERVKKHYLSWTEILKSVYDYEFHPAEAAYFKKCLRECLVLYDQYDKEIEEGKLSSGSQIVSWREAWEKFLEDYYGLNFNELAMHHKVANEKELVELIKIKYRPEKEML
ncbi:MAG: hypothetical protein WCT40_00010 [Candidatus Magasanikbacteria bacterium]